MKYTPNGNFRILRCSNCSFAFVSPRPTPEYIKSLYSDFGQHDGGRRSLDDVLKAEADYPNSTVDANRILEAILHILEHKPTGNRDKLLDVGCGYGFFSREALRRGFEVDALESASNERLIAEQIIGLKPISSSFEDFSRPHGSYSAVLMSQVLEHALDVNAWVDKARRLLVSGGVLAVASPNFKSAFRLVFHERDPYVCPPVHLNFFSPRSLSTLLVKHGFKLKEIQWVSRIDPNIVLRRIPLTKYIGLGIRFPLQAVLGAFDALYLGMMINIYACKS